MTKVKITKAMGEVEELTLLSAFKVENNAYAIFDGEKLGSMGLPIIYVSKLVNDKLEKINDTNEWQSAKNYLKGIINGTNFEYLKLNSEIKADEAYFTPLTLPSESALELIKSHYSVPEDNSGESNEGTSKTMEPLVTPDIPAPEESSIPEIPVISANPTVEANPIPPIPEVPVTPPADIPTPTIENIAPAMPEEQVVSSLNPENINNPVSNEIPTIPNIPLTNEINSNTPTSPVMPDNNVMSNSVVNTTNNIPSTPIGTYTATPTIVETPNVVPNPIPPITNPIPNNIPPVAPLEPVNQVVNPIPNVSNPINTPSSSVINENPNIEYNQQTINQSSINTMSNDGIIKDNFDSDRETFLKACENMFDALISKYQKQLAELNEREQNIKQKEMEIEQKMQNASEHLANAAAREQVANIAHDNAQKVMDLNNFMPTNNISNPNNQAGVI